VGGNCGDDSVDGSGDDGYDEENGGDGGGIDAATAAGTDTDNNQLKVAAEGGQRRRWR
jgi:hypothetical protein